MTTLFDIAIADAKPPMENGETRGRRYAERLERGDILFFPETPFRLPEEDCLFLLNQRQTAAAYHKNVAFRPGVDRLTGVDRRNRRERDRVRQIMRNYSADVTRFLTDLIPQYSRHLRIDYASFRPQEEQGRQLRHTARNDLLHVDSFPTRPTNGDRILRVFTNINPTRSRVWVTTDTFEVLLRRFAVTNGNGNRRAPGSMLLDAAENGFGSRLRGLLSAAGLPVTHPSPYDRIMHGLHNHMKRDEAFQRDCPKRRWNFPPHSTWIVFTDMVAHAVLSGQYALEQTYLLPRAGWILPGRAPIDILEGLCGQILVN